METQNRRLLEARWRLGEINESDLPEIADELLSAGEDAPSLVELFALTRDEARWKGRALFEQVLRELGAGDTSEAEAARYVTRDIARSILDGSLSPAEGAARAAEIHIRTGYKHDDFVQLYALHDEVGYPDRSGLTYSGRPIDDAIEDVRAEAKRLLASSTQD